MWLFLILFIQQLNGDIVQYYINPILFCIEVSAKRLFCLFSITFAKYLFPIDTEGISIEGKNTVVFILIGGMLFKFTALSVYRLFVCVNRLTQL